MKNAKVLHSLALNNRPSGKIRFIHFRDGKEHSFTSCVNQMTGHRLSYFDDAAPTVNDSLKWVRSVFRDIRKKATSVIEVIGDF